MPYPRHSSGKDPSITLACLDNILVEKTLVVQKWFHLPTWKPIILDGHDTNWSLQDRHKIDREKWMQLPVCPEFLFKVVFWSSSAQGNFADYEKVAHDAGLFGSFGFPSD